MTVEDNLKIGAFTPSARKQFRERLQFVYELFPILAERCAAICRYAFRRRTANVRHRQGFDVESKNASHG